MLSVRLRVVGLAPLDLLQYYTTNKLDRMYMIDMLDMIHTIKRIIFRSVMSIL